MGFYLLKRRALKTSLGAFLCCLAGLAEAKVNVVATVADLGAVAREVGGGAVDVKVLTPPTHDPHRADAKPSLSVAIRNADLLLLNGMEMEVGWLPVLLTQARNARVQKGETGYLDASTLIQPKEVPVQKVDRSMGDIHPGGNPHYLKDPRNAVLVARGITDRLATVDAPNADAYRANLTRFEAAMKEKIAAWEKLLEVARGKPVVTFHKSWVYFTEWAGLTAVGFIEPKPGLAPSASHVGAVLLVIKKHKVPMILQEEWYDARSSELLSQRTGAKLVRVPGMPTGNQTYAEYFDLVVARVADALK